MMVMGHGKGLRRITELGNLPVPQRELTGLRLVKFSDVSPYPRNNLREGLRTTALDPLPGRSGRRLRRRRQRRKQP